MEYLIKSSVIIAIFYLFYKVFLRNETYFKAIRWFLLSGLILSLVLPFVIFTKYTSLPQELVSETQIISESTIIPLVENKTTSLEIKQLIFSIYVTGVIILFIQFLINLGSLLTLLIKYPIRQESGLLFIETNKSISPFSFFNYVVFNPKQFKSEELKQIITHEKIHAKHLHSIDTVLIQLLTIFQWYNPFVWLYRKELQQNLEFITDEITQKLVDCKKNYQQLILKTSAPDYQLALANNFYNSILKKRILMLHKERSKNNRQWKLVFIIPILFAFLMTFNTQTIAQSSDEDKEVIEIKTEIIELLISKSSSEEGLKKLKDRFNEKGLKVNFSGIKRNSDNEITAIKIDAKATNGKASASYASDDDEPIKPIKISFDRENNSLSIGSTHGSRHAFHFSSNDGQKFIIKKAGKGTNEDVIHIETDGDHDSDIHVWNSKDGKKVKIGRTEDVEILTNKDGDEVEKKVVKIYRSGEEEDTFLFLDEDDDEDTKTIYMVNGKKVSKEALKKMDKKDIKTLEIKKEKKKKKN